VTVDETFFAEWERRSPGQKRSLGRARLLGEALGIMDTGLPVLTVVGSKGKGTIATYASACLAAAGLTVCTVTSPGLRSHRERIRINGTAITEPLLEQLSVRIHDAIAELPGPHEGYLSPAGLFTLAGVLHARACGADVVVLEAGMGGRSDEVSLFPPTVLAVGPVFAEHVGVLGDTPAAIAEEKAGVAAASTRAVLTIPQPAEIMDAIRRTITAELALGLETVAAAGIPDSLLPSGLSRANARLGCAAAQRLLTVLGLGSAPDALLAEVLRSVRLPGRLSWHRLAEGELLVDSAINRHGVAAALSAARTRWGSVDHVLACFPDHKDLDGAIKELAGLPVTFVRLDQGNTSFTRRLPPAWTTVEAAELTRERLDGLGAHVVALGTVYFTGRLLDILDVETDQLFSSSE
jgi:dihydrofolate synthase / folylpolyglutamate synthase